ncbi:23S rRNA (adenine(1618)-N(6))-methyltransferase [Aureococcus anophagefferens]|nr:23S rRNA (adenine(1618)-N(6))-methyltransferase [Aureococcus anophagefferens]
MARVGLVVGLLSRACAFGLFDRRGSHSITSLRYGGPRLTETTVRCNGGAAATTDDDRDGAARAYVATSAGVAAVMSFQAGSLAARGCGSVTALSCGVVAAAATGALAARSPSEARGKLPAVPFVAQALLGAVLPHLAFFAIPRAGLSVANCLMFTMPLWTALFASLASATFTRRDAAASATCLAGVVLVARPWAAARGSLAGCAAALAFGICGGALNVLVQRTSLKDASPDLLTCSQMAVTALLGLWSVDAGLIRGFLPGLAALGVLMALQASLRTRGLQLTRSPAVATLLYSEILWCFLLDIAFLGARPAALQVLGAALIVGGAVV